MFIEVCSGITIMAVTGISLMRTMVRLSHAMDNLHSGYRVSLGIVLFCTVVLAQYVTGSMVLYKPFVATAGRAMCAYDIALIGSLIAAFFYIPLSMWLDGE